MFDSIKGRIYSVQEGLSLSFRGLSTSDIPRRSHHGNDSCDNDAGADVLRQYQGQWSEVRHLAEDNAMKAEEVDHLIGQLYQNFEKQWGDVSHIASGLAALPQLLCTVHDLMEQLGSLQGLVEDVESSLLNLEDAIEVQEFQEKQLDHRFQLALYKEKQLAELEHLKERLAAEHSVKVREYEEKQRALLKERQETFGEAFEDDMMHYKLHGRIPRVEGGQSEKLSSLEDVTLEEDMSDLDAFLKDEAKCGTTN